MAGFTLLSLDIDGIIIILLSITFPYVSGLKEKYDRKIDNLLLVFSRYFNSQEFNKRENYFSWFDRAIAGGKEHAKFIVKVRIEENNPLLLPGRSGDENSRLIKCQKNIENFSRDIVVLNFIKFVVPIFVIYLLLIK